MSMPTVEAATSSKAVIQSTQQVAGMEVSGAESQLEGSGMLKRPLDTGLRLRRRPAGMGLQREGLQDGGEQE